MKRNLLIISVVLGILASIQVHCELDEDWSQVGSDNCRTFFSNTSIDENLKIINQYPLGLGKQTHFCELFSPAVVKGRIYILDVDNLYCLNLHTGELVYEVPAFTLYPYTPAIEHDKVYIATERTVFSCLHASTGEIFWQRNLHNVDVTGPLFDKDTIYITVDHFDSLDSYDPFLCEQRVPQWATLLALDSDTGEEIWRYSIHSTDYEKKCIGFPILVDGSILFGVSYQLKDEYGFTLQGKTNLISLDARTGTVQWEYENIFPFSPLDMGKIPFSLSYHDNNIFIGTNGKIICLNKITHVIKWEHTLQSKWTLLSVGDNTVVIRIIDWVYALDTDGGNIQWKVPIDGMSMHAMTKDDIFIGSDDGNLYRISTESGHITESYHLGGFLYSTVVARDHVIVGTSEGKIYCLGPSFPYSIIIFSIILFLLLLGIILIYKKTTGSCREDI